MVGVGGGTILCRGMSKYWGMLRPFVSEGKGEETGVPWKENLACSLGSVYHAPVTGWGERHISRHATAFNDARTRCLDRERHDAESTQ